MDGSSEISEAASAPATRISDQEQNKGNVDRLWIIQRSSCAYPIQFQHWHIFEQPFRFSSFGNFDWTIHAECNIDCLWMFRIWIRRFSRGPWSSEAEASSKIQLFARNPNLGGSILGARFQAGREGGNGQLMGGLDAAERICPNERPLIRTNIGLARTVAGESRWNRELTTAGGFSLLEIITHTSCRQRWKRRFVVRNCCGTAFRRNSRPLGRCWRGWRGIVQNQPGATNQRA